MKILKPANNTGTPIARSSTDSSIFSHMLDASASRQWLQERPEKRGTAMRELLVAFGVAADDVTVDLISFAMLCRDMRAILSDGRYLRWRLIDSFKIGNGAISGRCGPIVAKVIDRLTAAAGSTELVHAKALAEALAVTPSQLGRLLLAETGFGYIELRRCGRIRAAVRPLVEGKTSIKEMSLSAGYGPNNMAQFDKDFRRVTGVCPKEMRQAAQEPPAQVRRALPNSKRTPR